MMHLKEIKNMYQEMLTPLLQCPKTLQKKKYKCPTPNCATSSKYKQNIINHLKLYHTSN